MSLRLVIEHSSYRQPVMELSHPGGELSIGRGVEADWRLEDPDMYISRKHCIVMESEDGFTITDISRGGLYVDGAVAPLGAGRSCGLRDGMRLRMGDVVIRAEIREHASPAHPETGSGPRADNSFAADDFFAQRPIIEPPPSRPASLPDPFDAPRDRVRVASDAPAKRSTPPIFDDPFTLDPLPSAAPPQDTRPEQQAAPTAEPGRDTVSEHSGATGPAVNPEPLHLVSGAHPAGTGPQPSSNREPDRPVPPVEPRRSPNSTSSPALTMAFLKGMGLDPAAAERIGPAEMELLGRRFRALVEVLEQCLRSRAREKRNLRVAQTVIGSLNVNPFKFMPTTEDVLEVMTGSPRPGFMEADAAISAAKSDLADHQLRSWSGLQAALRRMIERFDPQEIERDLDAAGKLRAILAGGRSALLWQLYRERYGTIAKAAEDRFLGEVGSDFREAYEGQGRSDHDG